jgi:predicted secreted protein
MRWYSILAVYVTLWVISAFAVLPWGIRSHDDEKRELVAGSISSAPVNFRPRLVALRTTMVATTLFVLFVLNLHYRWITVATVTRLVPVPASLASQTLWQ